LRSAGDGVGDVVQKTGNWVATGGGAGSELLDEVLPYAGCVELDGGLVLGLVCRHNWR